MRHQNPTRLRNIFVLLFCDYVLDNELNGVWYNTFKLQKYSMNILKLCLLQHWWRLILFRDFVPKLQVIFYDDMPYVLNDKNEWVESCCCSIPTVIHMMKENPSFHLRLANWCEANMQTRGDMQLDTITCTMEKKFKGSTRDSLAWTTQDRRVIGGKCWDRGEEWEFQIVCL